MSHAPAVLGRNIRNAAENRIDKEKSRAIIFDMKIFNALTRRVDWERDGRERSQGLKASYSGTFAKTTSEWLQNSPVIPLSS